MFIVVDAPRVDVQPSAGPSSDLVAAADAALETTGVLLADAKAELAAAQAAQRELLERRAPWGLVGAGFAAIFFCLAGLLAALSRRRTAATTLTEHLFEASTLRRGALRSGLLALLLSPLALLPLALGGSFEPIALLQVAFIAVSAAPLILPEVWGQASASLARHACAAFVATLLATLGVGLGTVQVMFTISRLGSDSSQAWADTLKTFQDAPAIGLAVFGLWSLAIGAVWGLGVFQRLRAQGDAGWAGTLVRLPALALLIGVGFAVACLGVTASQLGTAWISAEAVMEQWLIEAGVLSGVVLVGLVLHGVAAWGADRLEQRLFPPPEPLPAWGGKGGAL